MLTDLHITAVTIGASHISVHVNVMLFPAYKVTTHNVTFSIVTPCSLVSDYQHFEGSSGYFYPGGLYVFPKHWYKPTILHGVITQNTAVAIFISVTVPYLIQL